MTVSRRTGFRRLHIVGGCHVQQSRCQEAYGLSSIEGAQFNAMCEVCKKKLKESIDDDGASSSGTSRSDGSSTSTEVNTSADEHEWSVVSTEKEGQSVP